MGDDVMDEGEGHPIHPIADGLDTLLFAARQ